MIKKINLVLLNLVLYTTVHGAVLGADASLSKKDFFKQVQQLSQTQDWASCVALSTKYLQAKPEDVDVLISRHYALRKLGRNEEALADMNAVINSIPIGKYVPSAWSWFEYRGDVLMDLQQWKNAAEDYSKAIQWCPSTMTSWFQEKTKEIAEKRRLCMEAQMKIATKDTVSSRSTESEDVLAGKIASLLKKELAGQQASSYTANVSTNDKTLAKPNPNRPVRDKWALVIGISKFANPKYNLDFAAKDARDFYNFLVNEANFKKDHVLLLLDEKATRSNIMSAFGDNFLPAVSQDDDLVVVYISTHGTPANKDKGGQSYIVAHDTNITSLYATGVNMDELYKRIRTGVKTDRALIVMDTCFSGAGVPGAKALNVADNFDAQEVAQGCGRLVITSSSPNERSWESKMSSNSVFTKYLLEALRSNECKINVKSAFKAVQEKVSWEVQNAFGEKQTPQLGGEWEGKELILSVPATQPRPMLNSDLLQLMGSNNEPTSRVNAAKDLPMVTKPNKPIPGSEPWKKPERVR